MYSCPIATLSASTIDPGVPVELGSVGNTSPDPNAGKLDAVAVNVVPTFVSLAPYNKKLVVPGLTIIYSIPATIFGANTNVDGAPILIVCTDKLSSFINSETSCGSYVNSPVALSYVKLPPYAALVDAAVLSTTDKSVNAIKVDKSGGTYVNSPFVLS